MTQRGRIRLISVFSLIAFTLGLGFTAYSLRRAATLQSLQVRIEVLLQSVYRLTTATNHLLYTATSFENAYEDWRRSIERANVDMAAVVTHPGMEILGEDLRVPVQQADRLFLSTVEGFDLARDLLDVVRARSLPDLRWSDLATTAQLVRSLQSASDLSAVQTSSYALVLQAEGQISQSGARLRLFVGNELEGLGEIVEQSTSDTIRSTLVGGSIAVVLLFTLMILALLSSIRYLATANDTLEENVRERTRAIQGLLDFSGQGFLSFGPDFLVRPEVSRECDAIFRRSVVGARVDELLYRDDQERADFTDALSLVFEEASSPEVVFDLLDRRIEIDGRTIEVDFRSIDAGSVMCSLRDITGQLRLESRIAAQRTRQEMVLRVVSNRSSFFALLDEWERIITVLGRHVVDGVYRASEDESRSILRDIHTFKANAAFLQFTKTSDAAHRLESVLTDFDVLGETGPIPESIAALSTAFRDEREFVVDALGADWMSRRDIVTVDRGKIDELLRHVRRNRPDDVELVAELEGIRKRPVADLLSAWSDTVEHLAGARGKRVRVAIEKAEGALPPESWDAVSHAALHLVRNMVDHGIEFPRERERSGKDPIGTITFSAEPVDGAEIAIRIADDGAGIRIDRIEEQARKAGLLNSDDTPKPEELVRLIFRPGFSTADVVTTVSGRGVGAAAALELVKSVNGRLSVQTRPRRGTVFTITVPDNTGGLTP